MRPTPQPVVFGFAEKPKPGSDGTNDVKRVGGVAAMRGRIGQRLDHLVKLDHRTRPAMRDDQRHRFRMRRTDVQEMNVEPVDFGGELRKAIEPRLAPAPIVLFRPIAADVLDPFQRRALAPVLDQFGFRPARVAQPRLEIVEHIVADRNAIGFDFSAHEGPFFKAQPELPGRISQAEIIVSREADIKGSPRIQRIQRVTATFGKGVDDLRSATAIGEVGSGPRRTRKSQLRPQSQEATQASLHSVS